MQSAHFSGKQFTLHCSIVDSVHTRYHFHLSDDATHDPVFVDHVLRDIIIKYDIRNQDLWIQSDNAPTQYKNKNAFFLLEKLAKEFNLRIIRTYGAAGHGKGVIDEISSFGLKTAPKKFLIVSGSISWFLRQMTLFFVKGTCAHAICAFSSSSQNV